MITIGSNDIEHAVIGSNNGFKIIHPYLYKYFDYKPYLKFNSYLLISETITF